MYIDLGSPEKLEIEELWGITECIICKRNLTLKSELSRSKLLPCLHAMCYKCFVRCDRGKPKCSTCAFSFNKEEIYDNKVLYEIVSDSDIPKIKDVLCTIHSTKVITHWCENCKEFICQVCVKHHGELKSTREHKIMSKDNYVSDVLCGTPKVAFPCELHPANELSIICHDCQAMTCRDCQLELHKDHSYNFIAEKADSAKTELYDVFKKVEYFSVIMNAALSKISDREKKIEERKHKMVHDIKKQFDMIEKLLRRRANELMAAAIKSADSKLKECEVNRTFLQNNLNSVEYCIKFVKCVLYTSSDPVLFYTKDLMLNRMKRISFTASIPCPVELINLSFKPENFEEIKELIQKFGTILEREDSDKNNWKEAFNKFYPMLMERNRLLNEQGDNLKVLQSQAEQFVVEMRAQSRLGSQSEQLASTPIERPKLPSQTVQLLVPVHEKSMLQCQNEQSEGVLKDKSKLRTQTKLSGDTLKDKLKLPSQTKQLPVPVKEKSKLQSLPEKSLVAQKEKTNFRSHTQQSAVPLKEKSKLPSHSEQLAVPPKDKTKNTSVIDLCTDEDELPITLKQILSNIQDESLKQLSPSAPSKTWHIPETVTLFSKPPVDESEIGNGIKKVRIPAQAHAAEIPADTFSNFNRLDEILNDLGVLVDKPSEVQGTPREEQSPPGLPNEQWCSVCLGTGGLVVCNNCPNAFHRDCHLPSIPFPLPSKWTCILCEEITPRPFCSLKQFTSLDTKIANRLLLELLCQYEASAPFKQWFRKNTSARFLCLLDIKSCLSSGQYSSISDFIRDVKMMFKNCFHFRQAEPDVIAHARSLQDIFTQLLSKFIPYANVNPL